MTLQEQVKYALCNPKVVLIKILFHISPLLSDSLYLKLKFRLKMGYKLNLKNPTSFSEKLQWLKLYDHNPNYQIMADKVRVKDYVAEKIGKEYIISTLGVWDDPDKINLDELPNQFVLKCNHNSGLGMYICSNKDDITPEKWDEIKKNLRKGLEEDYSKPGRDWCYRNIPRRILAEKFMVDESGTELKDYKFFCFDGVPKYMFVAKDRNKGEVYEAETKFDFFDMDFNHLPVTNGHPNSEPPYFKPEGFEKMKELASVLSKGIPHVRVDLYNINGHIYFGELTFCHWGGMMPFVPKEWDYKFGEKIKLPICKG